MTRFLRALPLLPTLLLTGLAVFLVAPGVRAQAERDLENASLQDIRPFALRVNIEGSPTLLVQPTLSVESLTRTLRDQLLAASLPLRPEDEADGAPYLYVHLNLLDAGRELVPFAASVQFYQAAHLERDRTQRVVAPTWEADVVGLVSMDELSFTTDAALNLVDVFIYTHQTVNAE